MIGKKPLSLKCETKRLKLLRESTITGANCLTLAHLRLHPQWDPLRTDPRFQKLCEEKKP